MNIKEWEEDFYEENYITLLKDIIEKWRDTLCLCNGRFKMWTGRWSLNWLLGSGQSHLKSQEYFAEVTPDKIIQNIHKNAGTTTVKA